METCPVFSARKTRRYREISPPYAVYKFNNPINTPALSDPLCSPPFLCAPLAHEAKTQRQGLLPERSAQGPGDTSALPFNVASSWLPRGCLFNRVLSPLLCPVAGGFTKHPNRVALRSPLPRAAAPKQLSLLRCQTFKSQRRGL